MGFTHMDWTVQMEFNVCEELRDRFEISPCKRSYEVIE